MSLSDALPGLPVDPRPLADAFPGAPPAVLTQAPQATVLGGYIVLPVPGPPGLSNTSGSEWDRKDW